MARTKDSTKKTYRDRRGNLYRICGECGSLKQLTPVHYMVAGRRPDGSIERYGYVCRPCSTVRKARWKATVRREDPEHWERIKASMRGTQKRWRHRRPDLEAAKLKRYRAKLKEDPERYLAYLESRRMAHRIRAERNGRKIVRQSPKLKRMATRIRRLPSAPLYALIATEAEVSERSITELGREIGVSQRNISRWGEGVQQSANLETADRVVTWFGLNWQDVFDDETVARLRS